MAILFDDKRAKDAGSWQDVFVPTYTERIRRLRENRFRTPVACIERARTEMKVYEQYKNEPRIIQRAHFLETFLREKTIFIMDDELIVGNITSKSLGYTVYANAGQHNSGSSGEQSLFINLGTHLAKPSQKIINPEDKKELEEVILPYFNGKTLPDYNMEKLDDELKEKASQWTASCKHIPNIGNLSYSREAGHQMPNFEKILYKGLRGIREEAEWNMAQVDQPYSHFGLEKKRDFYKAVLITIDAAIAYTKRYADLARQMAAKEANPKRKQELEHIAKVCDQVPVNPARDWWEALQSVWMIFVIVVCELGGVCGFGRFDQYMYPFYKKSVIDEKTMSNDEALELLECLWIKTNGPGFAESQSLNIGGQTRNGKDACNEVTMLCLEADEQLSMVQPETAMRIWAGTPDKYLKKALNLIRLGRGKPKFVSDRKGIQIVSKSFPDLTIGDWREFVMQGCTEMDLPHITMAHNWDMVQVSAKLMELVLNNGKCALCGKQIGPLTGDPRTFESIERVRQAFREQAFYWTKYLVKGSKVAKELQSLLFPGPFSSSLYEGPLQRGLDITLGGTWYTTYGAATYGLADTADSLGVIDKLIYHDKKITWDQLLDAIKANWKGYEDLRQLCINGVPKYGNDDDWADDWAAWVMDVWADCFDWINTQQEYLPYWGGKYICGIGVGGENVVYGEMVGGLPNGRSHPKPLADTMSPVQGVDKNGPTAMMKSVSKLPTHRLALGGPVNMRLSPQLLTTQRDLNNLVSLLRASEEMGIYHLQLNVVSSAQLRKAMKEPENYRDLLVRVGSYVSFFVELSEELQMDIINRTEKQGW